MSLVTVTYNAWDHNREVVPAELRPRIGFRPLKTSLDAGFMTDREIWGGLNTTTGAGAVDLERDMDYQPFMEWLTDPSQVTEAVQNRAMGRCEWQAFTAVTSGSIDVQPPTRGGRRDLWWVSLSPPRPGFVGMWLVSDPSITPADKGATLGDVRRVY